MGVGPNYVLNKGLLATGSTAYKAGECVTLSGDGTKCARATSAAAAVVFVCMEDLDTTRLATGKAVIGVGMQGIVRVLTGAAVAVKDKVANDATARAIPGGAAGTASFGIALTAASAAGQYIDVLLTPGNSM